MRILFDENIALNTFAQACYARFGHEVGVVTPGQTDEAIWQRGQSENWVIITRDADFIDLAAWSTGHCGMIRISPNIKRTIDNALEYVAQKFSATPSAELSNQVVCVTLHYSQYQTKLFPLGLEYYRQQNWLDGTTSLDNFSKTDPLGQKICKYADLIKRFRCQPEHLTPAQRADRDAMVQKILAEKGLLQRFY